MSRLKSSFLRRLRHFRRSQSGAVITVELMIFLPVLSFTMVGGYGIFDAYRERALAQKAAFTVSDLISRETETLNCHYFDSMFNLMDQITRTSTPKALRVSMLRWDEDANRFEVDGSQTKGSGYTPLTIADAVDYVDKLPELQDQEGLIVVETQNDYRMSVTIVDIYDIVFNDFVFTRPRFYSTVPFPDQTC